MSRLARPCLVLALSALPALPGAGATVDATFGRVPLAFEENRGQTDPAVRFVARRGGLALFLTQTEAVLALRRTAAEPVGPVRNAGPRHPEEGAVVRMRLTGAHPAPEVSGTGLLPGRSHYLDLERPGAGVVDVPQYERVVYRGVYPGVDLVFYGREGGLEYDFELAPGADPSAIALDFDGVDDLRETAEGDLVLCVAGGEIRMGAPVLFQVTPAGKRPVAGRFAIRGPSRVAFEVAAWDRSAPLVIDPTLTWSSYLGGNGDDAAHGIAIDGSGNVYVCGETLSTNFPTTAGSIQPNDLDVAGVDAFVSKINPTGTAFVYSTYLGLTGTQKASAVAVDSQGRAYVTGFSDNIDVDGDAFVTRLSAAGSSVAPANGGYVVQFGGTWAEEAFDVAVDASFNAWVTGMTLSANAQNFPRTPNAIQPNFGGGYSDAFATKLDANGAITYSTYLNVPGDSDQTGNAIALDPGGNVHVVGYHFPYCLSGCGTGDAFVVRMNAAGSAFSYLGVIPASADDSANDVAVDGSGNAYVAGTTSSTDFPTAGPPLQANNGGTQDAFFTKIDTAGNFLYSTYLGNAAIQRGNGIALDPTGNVHMCGVTAAVDPDGDAFTLRLIRSGSVYLLAGGYSVTYGGALYDGAEKIAADANGYAYVAGTTRSSDFPTTAGARQAAKGDANTAIGDAWVAKIGPSLPSLSVGNRTVTEGSSGTVNATFTVTLSEPSFTAVTVGWATANGTAVQPADYTAGSGTLTFNPRETSKTVTVAVKGDTLDEANETFSVVLSGSSANATIADGTGTGTITDDDAAPSLSVNDVTVTEGNAGTVNATFTVALSAVSGQTVTVAYGTADGTARQPADYTAASGTLTFTAGQTSKTVVVAVKGDVLDEANENFSLGLSSPVNATVADANGIGTITDDDAAPSLSVGNATVTEGNAGTVNATFTVTLSAVSGQTVTVAYATANGTAVQPADYAAASGTLTFTAGQTSKTVTVAVKGDVLDEANETYSLGLSSPVNATIADANGIGTITDDDAAPALSAGNATVTEGNAGTVNATFTVTLSAVSGQTVTVAYATANGTAAQPADYTAASGTLTFTAGQTSKTATVAVKGDVLDEANETYSLVLSSPVNATIADGTGLGTITDDDVSAASGLYPVQPCRVLDTRNPNGPLGGPALAARATRDFVLPPTCGIPADARSVSVNLTVTGAASGGYLSIHPSDTARPVSSAINFQAGQTRANNAILKLPADGSGTISVYNGGGTVHFILDVNGFFR